MIKLFKCVPALYCLLATGLCYAQKNGFEQLNSSTHFPENVFSSGKSYSIQADSIQKHSGKYAIMISSLPNVPAVSAGTIGFNIPVAGSKHQSVTLKGWIKTTGLTGNGDGRAGLWLRIDGEKGPLGFTNMMNQPIVENINWTPFEISLPFAEGAQKIVAGGMLVGQGKVWFDDLELEYQSYEEKTTSSEIALNAQNIKHLYMLGRVWGMLKYFHPAVAAGKYNWDAELLKELPKVSESHEAFNQEILGWVNSLGNLPACRSCQPHQTDSLLRKNQWIADDNLFSRDLQAQLIAIIRNRNTGSNKYVKMRTGYGNPDFGGENTSAGLPSVDLNYRLLTLFRYWNMVEYFFPYKNLMGVNWDEALVAMIPQFINASSSLAYKLAVWRMINQLHDTHANLYSSFTDPETMNFLGGQKLLPIKLTYIENNFAITHLYDTLSCSMLQKGDVLLKIDGRDIAERVSKLKPYACASNEITEYLRISSNLTWTNKDTIAVQVQRNNQKLNLRLPAVSRAEFAQLYQQSTISDTSNAYRFLTPNIGYLRIDLARRNNLKQIFNDLKNAKGLIIDLRYYPQDNVLHQLNEYIRNQPVAFAKFSHTQTSTPGLFSLTEHKLVGNRRKEYYIGKVVVLVNENTQSAAEFCAMSLRAGNRALIMGSQTAGADGDISMIKLPGGLVTYFSGLGVYYPDGTGTQRTGIVPDIEVKPTLYGIRNNRDEVLEKAIAYLH